MTLEQTKLKTNDDLDGSPPHPHDMAAANRTLSCDKKKQNFTSTHELTQASHFGPDLLRQIHDNFALTRKFSVRVVTFGPEITRWFRVLTMHVVLARLSS